MIDRKIVRQNSTIWFIYDNVLINHLGKCLNFKIYDISISNKNIGGTYEKGRIKNEWRI